MQSPGDRGAEPKGLGLLFLRRKVVRILGPVGTITLIGLVLGTLLLLGYMVLRFGEKGTEMFLPFLRESVLALRRESAKTHPAIRIEFRLHCLFGTIVFFCLAASLLHALVPWLRDSTERLIFDAFITSFIVCIALASVSIGLSLRLK